MGARHGSRMAAGLGARGARGRSLDPPRPGDGDGPAAADLGQAPTLGRGPSAEGAGRPPLARPRDRPDRNRAAKGRARPVGHRRARLRRRDRDPPGDPGGQEHRTLRRALAAAGPGDGSPAAGGGRPGGPAQPHGDGLLRRDHLLHRPGVRAGRPTRCRVGDPSEVAGAGDRLGGGRARPFAARGRQPGRDGSRSGPGMAGLAAVSPTHGRPDAASCGSWSWLLGRNALAEHRVTTAAARRGKVERKGPERASAPGMGSGRPETAPCPSPSPS